MAQNLNMLVTAGIFFVVLTIVISMGGQILGQLQSTQTANSIESNITGQGLTAMSNFGDWFTVFGSSGNL